MDPTQGKRAGDGPHPLASIAYVGVCVVAVWYLNVRPLWILVLEPLHHHRDTELGAIVLMLVACGLLLWSGGIAGALMVLAGHVVAQPWISRLRSVLAGAFALGVVAAYLGFYHPDLLFAPIYAQERTRLEQGASVTPAEAELRVVDSNGPSGHAHRAELRVSFHTSSRLHDMPVAGLDIGDDVGNCRPDNLQLPYGQGRLSFSCELQLGAYHGEINPRRLTYTAPLHAPYLGAQAGWSRRGFPGTQFDWGESPGSRTVVPARPLPVPGPGPALKSPGSTPAPGG